MSSKLTRIALLLTALYAAAAGADDPNPAKKLSFSGFGTLGVVHSSEGQADFRSTIFKPNGAGYSHTWSAAVDSLIAAQVVARPTSKLSVVVQVISEQKHDDTYWPHVEWANVKYQLTSDLSFRVGRTVVPIFLVADSRKINYANPWVRPPVEVYGLVPFTRNDGIDVSYRLRARSATNTFQVSAGRSDSRVPAPGAFRTGVLTQKARGLVTLVDTIELGFVVVRFNYGRTRLTIPEVGALFDGFRQFGPRGVAIADTYDVNDRLSTFFGTGATYDPGKWFVMGEWGRTNTRSIIGERTAWYASGGYRIRSKLTASVSYAQVKADSNTSDPGLTVSALPPFLAGPATSLNAALNSALSAKITQDTTSVGGRWDFTKNATLKMQLDHSRLGAGSPGTLANLQPGFEPGGKLYVFTAALDFVF